MADNDFLDNAAADAGQSGACTGAAAGQLVTCSVAAAGQSGACSVAAAGQSCGGLDACDSRSDAELGTDGTKRRGAPRSTPAANRPPVSVALAAKDGALYLQEQVLSILPQLHLHDELIISVDPSSDDTLALAKTLADEYARAQAPENAARVVVLEGPGQGLVANFEQALQACANDFILLADQDDVWLEDKVSVLLKAFQQTDALLICHDAAVVDENLQLLEPSYFSWHKSCGGLLRTILRNSYVGCCLAIRRELLKSALPFPKNLPMHDQWLGLMAEKQRRTFFLECPLILYRRHGATTTGDKHARPAQMLSWRLALVRALLSFG